MKMETSQYYNMGSAVPVIEPNQYPNVYEPKVSPRKRHVKTKAERLKEKQQIMEMARYHLKFLFTASVIFAGCIVMMMFNATITEKQENIKQLNYQLNTLKEENLSLEADISAQLDLKYIEKEATERLGMSKPADYQIVYIDVPKSNYTVQYDVETEIDNKGLLDAFKEFVLGLINR